MSKFFQTVLSSVILITSSSCTAFTSASPTLTPTTSPTLISILTITPTSQQGTQSGNMQTKVDVTKIVSSEQIKNFLIEKIGATAYGGKVFCAYQVMGAEQGNQTIQIYLWVLVQEYYVGQQSLEEGTGTSEPVVIFVKMQDGKYQIFDYKDAGVGYQYLEENFPPDVLPLINLPADEYNQRSASLLNETRKEAETYFGIQK